MSRLRDEAAGWWSSLRFSGFTVLVVVLVIGGTVILGPSLSTYIQQRREIAELEESVRQHREAVDEIDAERAKWKDPAYVRAQARERLFYVLPGETQLNVIDDVTLVEDEPEETNAELAEISQNWAEGLTESFLVAGTTQATAEDSADGTADDHAKESAE